VCWSFLTKCQNEIELAIIGEWHFF
jgi:hypothetical protein